MAGVNGTNTANIFLIYGTYRRVDRKWNLCTSGTGRIRIGAYSDIVTDKRKSIGGTLTLTETVTAETNEPFIFRAGDRGAETGNESPWTQNMVIMVIDGGDFKTIHAEEYGDDSLA